MLCIFIEFCRVVIQILGFDPGRADCSNAINYDKLNYRTKRVNTAKTINALILVSLFDGWTGNITKLICARYRYRYCTYEDEAGRGLIDRTRNYHG